LRRAKTERASSRVRTTGNLRRPGDALDLVHEIELSLEYLGVKKEQGAERLVLSGRSDMALDGKVGEERGDFLFSHGVGVAFIVEEDEATNPVEINGLSANAVMLDAQVPADAIEQFRR
jgi:hypothetical protein